jgi:phage-related baseplate assembly protein
MLDRTKISFEELVDQLVAILKTKDAWKDAYLQSTGRTLIELYAYVAQLLLYYLKRSFEEMFVDSAQYWESLCKIANMLEAHVKRPVGASGVVKLKLKEASSVSVVVPRETQLTCDGVLFYTASDVVFNPGEVEKEVVVRQGVWVERSFVSGGDQLRQDYTVTGSNVSDLDVEVYVGSKVYTVVQYFGQVFDELQAKVWTSPDRALNVSFLRGFGVPSYGEVVRVRYSEVDPSFFPSVNSQWSVVGDDRFVVVADLSKFSRGAGWEDVESFRQRLEGWFGVGKRAVTKEDFWYMVSSVAGVGKVQVVDVKDNFNAPFREVEIYVADASGNVPSVDILNRVKGFLDKAGSVGVLYTVKPVQIVNVDVYVRAYISRVFSSVVVQGKVMDAIRELYSNLGVQEWVSIDMLKRAVLSVEGVRQCEVILPAMDLQLKKGQLVKLRQLRVDVLVGG